MARMSYWGGVLVGFDNFCNTLLAGYPDETISSRIYRSDTLTENPKKRWVIAHKVVNALFFFQPEHCKAAYEAEKTRKDSPNRE